MATHGTERADAVVVGGGVFGCWIASLLVQDHGVSVVLLEREGELLRRASYNNQARIHNGYHYPRSILTGLRSRVNSVRFLAEFADCVDRDFQMYYGVGRARSNVTAAQFREFCARIRAPLAPAEASVTALFDRALVEAVYKVDEWAFDADRLRARLRDRMDGLRVDVRLSTPVARVERGDGADTPLRVLARDGGTGTDVSIATRWVFNCTYSNLNSLLRASGLKKIPLKHEMAEIVLVDVPRELARIGVTLMCGPFFSFMPFPPRGLHTLSHVRYTPHRAWLDDESDIGDQEHMDRALMETRFEHMRRDAARYMPIVGSFVRRESLFELKTVLPKSESDDSRPILFKRDAGLPGLTCVLGGKIDNVFDVERELASLLAGTAA